MRSLLPTLVPGHLVVVGKEDTNLDQVVPEDTAQKQVDLAILELEDIVLEMDSPDRAADFLEEGIEYFQMDTDLGLLEDRDLLEEDTECFVLADKERLEPVLDIEDTEGLPLLEEDTVSLTLTVGMGDFLEPVDTLDHRLDLTDSCCLDLQVAEPRDLQNSDCCFRYLHSATDKMAVECRASDRPGMEDCWP